MGKEGDELGYRNLPNTLSGAKKLESLLVKIMEENGFSTLKIGTEATSFLDLHLLDFLASSEKLAPFNPSIYQLNAKIVRNFKKAYPDKDKTDKIDAFVIADRLRFGRLPEPYENHRPYLPLRRLTRHRFHLVESIAREKAYFVTHLYLKFSGYAVTRPFATVFGTTSLAVITDLSPDEILNMPIEELTTFIIKKGKNRFRETHKRWLKL